MSTPDFMPILSRFKHNKASEGACFMEYASFLAGEEFSDAPACADPILTLVCQMVNDNCTDDQRRSIVHLVPRVIGTRQARTDPALCYDLVRWADGLPELMFRTRGASMNTFSFVAADIIFRSAEMNSFYSLNPNSGNYYLINNLTDPAGFLTALFDEFERLTGHKPQPVDQERWEAACALTGAQ